jgi:hypothetical protein
MTQVVIVNFRNRTDTVTQDWQLSFGGVYFDLLPRYKKPIKFTLTNNTSIGISISTHGSSPRFAAATLTYTFATNMWTFASHTPTIFALQQTGNTVDFWCSLDNTFMSNMHDKLEISISEATFDPKEPDEPKIQVSDATHCPNC